jgi:hypothetical protein
VVCAAEGTGEFTRLDEVVESDETDGFDNEGDDSDNKVNWACEDEVD